MSLNASISCAGLLASLLLYSCGTANNDTQLQQSSDPKAETERLLEMNAVLPKFISSLSDDENPFASNLSKNGFVHANPWMSPGMAGLRADAEGETYSTIISLAGKEDFSFILGNSKREGILYLRGDAIKVSSAGYEKVITGLFPMQGIGTVAAASDVWNAEGTQARALIHELLLSAALTNDPSGLSEWYSSEVKLHNSAGIIDLDSWKDFLISERNTLKSSEQIVPYCTAGNGRIGLCMFDSQIGSTNMRNLIIMRFNENDRIVEEWRYSQEF